VKRPPNYQKGLAVTALIFGAFALLAGSPRVQSNARIDVAGLARTIENEDDHVTAVELAQWIKSQRPDLRVIDVRDSAAFEEYHIPRAERIALDDLVTTSFSRDETLVLYSEGGAHAAQGWVLLRAMGYKRVYFLRGGLDEWLADIMNPTLAASASDSARASFTKLSEISKYFGGLPRIGDSTAVRPAVRLRGRGC
jgi:rhodanese-related sulfurtransferase